MADMGQLTSKFRSKVERKIFEFLNNKIKEQVIDFTVLYLRKNKIPHDAENLGNIIEVFRLAMDDSYYKNIDGLLDKIETDVEEFAEEINPLDSTDSSSNDKKVVMETVRAPKKESAKTSKTSKSR